MLRHQQLLLLRALAQARSGTGGTAAIPTMFGSVVVGPQGSRPAFPGFLEEQQHQQQQQPQWWHPRAAFASRAPSFLDPQGRQAMKQKRQAKQRQRLLRESFVFFSDWWCGGTAGCSPR
jgi:hypothetical protein